jgi:O-antigen/teichoic acid export membrane protein
VKSRSLSADVEFVDAAQVMQVSAQRPSRPFPRSTAAAIPGPRNVRRNVAVKLSETTVRLVLGMVVTSSVSRSLGAGSFGTLSYIWSLVAIATACSSLGLDQLVARASTASPHLAISTLRVAARMRAIAATLIGPALIGGLAFATVGMQSSGAVIAGCLATICATGELFAIRLQAVQGSTPVARARLLAFVIGSTAKLAAVVFLPSLTFLAVASVVEPAFVAILTTLMLRRHDAPYTDGGSDDVRPGSLLRSGLPLLTAGVFVILYMRLDMVMLAAWSTPNELGTYAAATRLSEFSYFIPAAICTALLPHLHELYQRDEKSALLLLQRAWVGALGLALALTVTLCLFGPTIVRLLFGPEYGEVGIVLRLHAASSLAVFVGMFRETWFLLRNKASVTLWCTLGGAVVNIALNAVLIGPLGAKGAAIATTCSYLIAVFIVPWVFPVGREFLGVTVAAMKGPTRNQD